METAVVLCSGGLNSAVAAALAKQEYELALLHARIPHRAAARERENFDALARHFNPAHVQHIDLPHLAELGDWPRLRSGTILPTQSASAAELAATAIPGMMGSLIAAAHGWACSLGAPKVFIGCSDNLGPPCPRTASFWPDYSREYVSLASQMLAAAYPDMPVSICAPVIDLSRGEIVQLGRKVGVPFEHTWSCLEREDVACRRCTGCATRARGFVDAMMPDPALKAVAAIA